MKTSLYLPILGFTVNKEDGTKLIYENLVQSGPAYKLVVHESESWLNLKDELPKKDTIEIISQKQSDEYKEIAHRFFAPISDKLSYNPDKNGIQSLSVNITLNLRRALSYILIANDYKARIYDNSILQEDYNMTPFLKRHQDVFSEEEICRVEFVEQIMNGYRTEPINTITMNQDSRTFNKVLELWDNEQIGYLSELNHKFGMLNVHKESLKRDIKTKITEIIQNKWFPYITGGITLALSYHYSLTNIEPILSWSSSILAEQLSSYDFRKYLPPIQDARLFSFAKESMGVFMYTWFNYEYTWAVPRK